MKKQLRKSVFETNSSSTHSICINSTGHYMIPEKIHFENDGCFGWDWETYHEVYAKAGYLYIALLERCHWHCEDKNNAEQLLNAVKDVQNELTSMLTELGVKEVTFDDVKISEYTYGDKTSRYISFEGYIDHTEDLCDFVAAVMEDKELLAHYLFCPDSCVITGNDNSDESLSSYVPETCDVEFYKGN